jgi:DNA-directed RNA polymerase subunit RPC12/RpoP
LLAAAPVATRRSAKQNTGADFDGPREQRVSDLDPNPTGPPDWTRIPCAVPCARCGADLRGTQQPQCPSCGLEFAWEKAIPLESLRCPDCGYNLYGLPTNRCAECGRSFTWDDLPRPMSPLAHRLIEQRGRSHPLRSGVFTWWVTQRPRRFWRGLSIQDPVRPRPLGIFLLALLVCGGLAAIAFHVLSDYGLWREYRSVVGSGGSFRWAPRAYETWTGLFLMAGWIACSLLTLLLFPQTMRRARIRYDHLLRVGVYAVAAPGTGAVVATSLVLALSLFSDALLVPAAYPAWFAILLLVAALGAGRSLRIALRDYLRISHATSVAVVTQLIAVLSAWVLLRSSAPRFVAWHAARALNYLTHLVLTTL